MTVTKQNNYITAELEFAELQLKGWRQYIEANPINTLEDRWGKKEMPKGGFAWVVTATAEQQIKCVQDTLTKYLQLLEVVERLREKESAKVEVRGKTKLGAMAEDYLKNRK